MHLNDLASMIRGDYLRRSDTDADLPDASVYRALNLARREIWAELVGNDGDTLTLDLVANQSTYALDPWTPEKVLSVAVADASGLVPRRIPACSTSFYLERFPWYPRTDGQAMVQGYQVRMWAAVQPVSEIWADPMGIGAAAAVHGYVLSLWPAPVASIRSGISIQLVGACADLSAASPDSAIPELMDVAAALRAAVRLSPRLGRDPSVAEWLPELKDQAKEAFRAATRHRQRLNGGSLLRMRPQGFGSTRVGGYSDPYAPIGLSTAATPTPATPAAPNTTVSPDWTHVDVIPTPGTSAVTVDLDAVGALRVRAGYESEARAVSQDMAEIFDVDATVLAHITATLRTDPVSGVPFVFNTGDTVRFWYPV